MAKIGLFYGSGMGNTERVAQMIKKELGDAVDLHNIAESFADEIRKYDALIFGTSTWQLGDLEDDWDAFFPDLDTIDFKGKKLALFGVGDQRMYGETFCSGLRILYDKVKERGATVVGDWPTDGYEFEHSAAVEDGHFVGLALDEENQANLTPQRVKRWVEQIKGQLL
jgi:flavodoxin I